MSSGIERSIVRLDLESQGQFVALINAMEMQIESGQPAVPVVKLLGEALVALAQARGVDAKKLRLHERLDALMERIQETSGIAEER